MSGESQKSQNILVTGFGPFGVHKVNASWQAVKLLPDRIDGFNIVKREVPVSYQDVDEYVPSLWKELQPTLVVHVGVSSFATKITLEKRAYRTGFHKLDCYGKCHPTGDACCDGENCISTGLDVAAICSDLDSRCRVESCVSDDAGRYLCEYIYYMSLKVDKTRTLFIHVPPADVPDRLQELSEGILNVIRSALEQLQGQ